MGSTAEVQASIKQKERPLNPKSPTSISGLSRGLYATALISHLAKAVSYTHNEGCLEELQSQWHNIWISVKLKL